MHTGSLWENSWKCRCHWTACFSLKGHGSGNSGGWWLRWWWGEAGALAQCVHWEHSAHTHIPPIATSTTPPPPIRMSELKLLTAVTGPVQGGDGGGWCCCCRGVVHLFGSLAQLSGLQSLMQPGLVKHTTSGTSL